MTFWEMILNSRHLMSAVTMMSMVEQLNNGNKNHSTVR